MFYTRLMMFIPFLRFFLLLDEEIVEGWTPVQPDYTELDELVKLHAQVMLHMNELGWPMGKEYQIQVNEQLVETLSWRGWASRRHFEPVYHSMFGISIPGGMYIMRSGAIYGRDHYFGETMEYEGIHARWTRPLDMARMDKSTRRDVRWALENLLSQEPSSVHS